MSGTAMLPTAMPAVPCAATMEARADGAATILSCSVTPIRFAAPNATGLACAQRCSAVETATRSDRHLLPTTVASAATPPCPAPAS